MPKKLIGFALLSVAAISIPALALTLNVGESITISGTTVSCEMNGGQPNPPPIRVISSFCRCGGYVNRVLQKVSRYSDGSQTVDDLHEFTDRPGRNAADCVAAIPTWPGCEAHR